MLYTEAVSVGRGCVTRELLSGMHEILHEQLPYNGYISPPKAWPW